MKESYKDQFTPQKEDSIGPVFLPEVCNDPQCKEDLQAIDDTWFVYDMYFANTGIICGAPKS